MAELVHSRAMAAGPVFTGLKPHFERLVRVYQSLAEDKSGAPMTRASAGIDELQTTLRLAAATGPGRAELSRCLDYMLLPLMLLISPDQGLARQPASSLREGCLELLALLLESVPWEAFAADRSRAIETLERFAGVLEPVEGAGWTEEARAAAYRGVIAILAGLQSSREPAWLLIPPLHEAMWVGRIVAGATEELQAPLVRSGKDLKLLACRCLGAIARGVGTYRGEQWADAPGNVRQFLPHPIRLVPFFPGMVSTLASCVMGRLASDHDEDEAAWNSVRHEASDLGSKLGSEVASECGQELAALLQTLLADEWLVPLSDDPAMGVYARRLLAEGEASGRVARRAAAPAVIPPVLPEVSSVIRWLDGLRGDHPRPTKSSMDQARLIPFRRLTTPSFVLDQAWMQEAAKSVQDRVVPCLRALLAEPSVSSVQAALDLAEAVCCSCFRALTVTTETGVRLEAHAASLEAIAACRLLSCTNRADRAWVEIVDRSNALMTQAKLALAAQGAPDQATVRSNVRERLRLGAVMIQERARLGDAQGASLGLLWAEAQLELLEEEVPGALEELGLHSHGGGGACEGLRALLLSLESVFQIDHSVGYVAPVAAVPCSDSVERVLARCAFPRMFSASFRSNEAIEAGRRVCHRLGENLVRCSDPRLLRRLLEQSREDLRSFGATKLLEACGRAGAIAARMVELERTDREEDCSEEGAQRALGRTLLVQFMAEGALRVDDEPKARAVVMVLWEFVASAFTWVVAHLPIDEARGVVRSDEGPRISRFGVQPRVLEAVSPNVERDVLLGCGVAGLVQWMDRVGSLPDAPQVTVWHDSQSQEAAPTRGTRGVVVDVPLSVCQMACWQRWVNYRCAALVVIALGTDAFALVRQVLVPTILTARIQYQGSLLRSGSQTAEVDSHSSVALLQACRIALSAGHTGLRPLRAVPTSSILAAEAELSDLMQLFLEHITLTIRHMLSRPSLTSSGARLAASAVNLLKHSETGMATVADICQSLLSALERARGDEVMSSLTSPLMLALAAIIFHLGGEDSREGVSHLWSSKSRGAEPSWRDAILEHSRAAFETRTSRAFDLLTLCGADLHSDHETEFWLQYGKPPLWVSTVPSSAEPAAPPPVPTRRLISKVLHRVRQYVGSSDAPVVSACLATVASGARVLRSLPGLINPVLFKISPPLLARIAAPYPAEMREVAVRAIVELCVGGERSEFFRLKFREVILPALFASLAEDLPWLSVSSSMRKVVLDIDQSGAVVERSRSVTSLSKWGKLQLAVLQGLFALCAPCLVHPDGSAGSEDDYRGPGEPELVRESAGGDDSVWSAMKQRAGNAPEEEAEKERCGTFALRESLVAPHVWAVLSIASAFLVERAPLSLLEAARQLVQKLQADVDPHAVWAFGARVGPPRVVLPPKRVSSLPVDDMLHSMELPALHLGAHRWGDDDRTSVAAAVNPLSNVEDLSAAQLDALQATRVQGAKTLSGKTSLQGSGSMRQTATALISTNRVNLASALPSSAAWRLPRSGASTTLELATRGMHVAGLPLRGVEAALVAVHTDSAAAPVQGRADYAPGRAMPTGSRSAAHVVLQTLRQTSHEEQYGDAQGSAQVLPLQARALEELEAGPSLEVSGAGIVTRVCAAVPCEGVWSQWRVATSRVGEMLR
jgi:hypothetical protein